MRPSFPTGAEYVAIDPEKAENMSEFNELPAEGGALASQASELVSRLQGMGIGIEYAQAVEITAAMEAATWDRWESAKPADYGMALWPCGHVQMVDLRTRARHWHPAPTHWRAVYVPPALAVGAAYKAMAGSVVRRSKPGVRVQGGGV